MDAAEPPRVALVIQAECADRDRAEEALRQALGQTRAPGKVLSVRIEAATTPPGVTAYAEITGDAGASEARQVLAGQATDCSGLARNAGAWAATVLASNGLQPLPPPPAATAAPAPPVSRMAPAIATPQGAVPVMPESPPPEVARSEEAAPLEVGVGTFLMAGGAAGGYMGVSPFLIDDVGQAVFLRPSIGVGQSVATNLTSTWAAGRLDTCMRLPGRYATRGGLQLDLCGGADVGLSYVGSGTLAGSPPQSQTLPYVDLGPSVDLRAEVGSLAVTLRGVAGVNVARDAYDDVDGNRVEAPALSWRLEIDFSWVFYTPRKEALVSIVRDSRTNHGLGH